MTTHSRLLEEPPHTAAHQQEELLGEEDPGDLLHRGAGLTSQVQDGGSQEGDAQAEAEEDAPVGEGLLQVLLQQGPELLLQQLHLAHPFTAAPAPCAAVWWSSAALEAQSASRQGKYSCGTLSS